MILLHLNKHQPLFAGHLNPWKYLNNTVVSVKTNAQSEKALQIEHIHVFNSPKLQLVESHMS